MHYSLYNTVNYTIRKLRDLNAIATQIEINNGTKETKNLDVLISSDISVLVSRDDLETEFSPEISINENLSAPISQGQIIGKIVYTIDEIEYSTDLIASHSVKKSNFLILIVQILLIILILFFLYKLLFDNNFEKMFFRKNIK